LVEAFDLLAVGSEEKVTEGVEAISESFEGQIVLKYKIDLGSNPSLVGNKLRISWNELSPVITPRGKLEITETVEESTNKKKITLIKKDVELSIGGESPFEPKGLQDVINNPVSKGVLGSVIVASILGYTTTVTTVGCFNPGVGFIKFF
jgi:hypothetical protein